MAITTFKTTAVSDEGFTIECESASGKKLVLDEPKDHGGKDLGMNPCEGLLGAIGACQTMVAKGFAKMKGINLENIVIEVEGDIDLRGYKGAKDVPIGFQEIRSIFHIKADNTEEQIREFVKFVESSCPVGVTVKNSAKVVSVVDIQK
ncbi:Uncharacterized OsmC-related protein [Peptoclostridium litorale DSM 5388]|uniref:Putative redox protein, regulator of disulfide bond formation n=1 Tax=Peptoclostridium litorale DSM 5388 TaxID=1121324 RepID=A0A069RII2_PEPLI|nr:OsmC family protein [Peptoclostridium litorale]KDR96588.1 putative redox protein, regulator of disulfide bond formation [Peptoclostridium litorale DSM 5388]SIN68774.1 Uncharacterized OsmC-related protein [Peptoclostridium litorale DSM 5388]